MNHEYYISGYSNIIHNRIYVNGKMWMSADNLPFDSFAETAYRKLDVNYPKFHKMDKLTRLGWLAAELIVEKNQVGDPYKKGIVISEKHGSMDTDLRHIGQMQSGHASPAVFVYSLPNIVLGDICIRHGWKGENTCFISEKFDPSQQVRYISQLLTEGVLDSCLGGWLDLVRNSYQAFFYTISKNHNGVGIPFTIESLNRLFITHE